MIRRIIQGCGYLPGYGSHPGTGILIVFVLWGAAAGAEAGWRGMLLGGLVMLAVFGPMYIYGAYDRARDFDLWTARMKRNASDSIGGSELNPVDPKPESAG